MRSHHFSSSSPLFQFLFSALSTPFERCPVQREHIPYRESTFYKEGAHSIKESTFCPLYSFRAMCRAQRTHSIQREHIPYRESTFHTERKHSIQREHIPYRENTFHTERTHSIQREHILPGLLNSSDVPMAVACVAKLNLN